VQAGRSRADDRIMKRGLGEVAASVASAAIVAGLLVASDERVERRVAALLHDPLAASRATGDRLADALYAVWAAAREQGLEQAPLFVLAVVAAVLVVLLSRI
jgi:chromosome segregation and condensation protein ScpB